MQIDRRITNGLAWAGAALIVAVPAVDFVVRQFNPASATQVAVVQEEAAAETDLPTPVEERPAPIAEPVVREVAEVPASNPAETATAPRASGDGAVDAFIQSGRPLPSYISDGGTPAQTTAPARPQIQPPAAQPQPQPQPQTQPQQTTPPPATESVASVTRTRIVTLPTPASQRPPSVAIAPPPPVTQAPPLVIDTAPAIVTADDLIDWETGPLSDFLANRNGQQSAPVDDAYDPNGFFLDQGPNSRRGQRFPPAYDEDYYFPFGQ